VNTYSSAKQHMPPFQRDVHRLECAMHIPYPTGSGARPVQSPGLDLFLRSQGVVWCPSLELGDSDSVIYSIHPDATGQDRTGQKISSLICIALFPGNTN
jgi:hypothetical protein